MSLQVTLNRPLCVQHDLLLLTLTTDTSMASIFLLTLKALLNLKKHYMNIQVHCIIHLNSRSDLENLDFELCANFISEKKLETVTRQQNTKAGISYPKPFQF